MGGLGAALRILAVLTVAAGSCVQAQEKSRCEQFSWSLNEEKAWFAGPLDPVSSGARIDSLAEGAFALRLEPVDTLSFVLPPEGKPKEGKPNGAIVTFGSLAKPGRFQVTLSDEAWIDVIQNNDYSPSVGHTGVHGCPGLRKSVRFDLDEGPLVLQLSAASAPRLSVAVRQIE